MTQFITLTILDSNDNVRVNLEAVVHYLRATGDKWTDVLLSNGGLLKVQESASAIDDLIRNKGNTAIVSADG
jgi:hypothetical protein